LVPAFHHHFFGTNQESRCIVNIGGIANITFLPNATTGEVSGFDTGPGNALMDAWTREHLGEPFDRDGRWAAGATVDDELLQAILRDPFFHGPPPKSTGRGHFNGTWLRGQLAAFPRPPTPAVVQRTLCELTARTIAMAIAGFGAGDERVLLCGGGAHNPVLRNALKSALAPREIDTTTKYGLDVDHVEASAFAWLAMRTLNGLPGNLPAVTGAKQRVVLGGIYPA
jgi:anhydro-N-acetylmuramic acid kinase